MGERSNAQGLDLNRDHMKLETPEASSLVRAYQAYDPHVVIDLHTTNGTQHAYHLTYAPPLHPNTHPLIDGFLRDVWLPTVTETIKTSDGWNFYYYGNLSPVGTEAGWYSFDHRPRFNNNYVGLRNRIAILGEAYAYAPFEERVAATLRFVEESLNFAHTQAGQIATLVESADRDSVVGRRLATRAAPHRSTQQVEILLGQTEELQNPYSRAPIRRRLDVIEPTMLYEYGTFTALEGDTEIAPASYYVPADLTSVVNLLIAHQPLDILTMLGFVILIGVVVNAAILIVHQTLNVMRNEADIEPREAIRRAVESRVRPIFMSTITSALGMLPLVVLPGAGSELYRGLGSVVIGGPAVSLRSIPETSVLKRTALRQAAGECDRCARRSGRRCPREYASRSPARLGPLPSVLLRGPPSVHVSSSGPRAGLRATSGACRPRPVR